MIILLLLLIETVAIFNALYRNDIKFKLKEKRLSIQYIAYYIKPYVKHIYDQKGKTRIFVVDIILFV